MGSFIYELIGRFNGSAPPVDAPERPIGDSFEEGKGARPAQLIVNALSTSLPPVPELARPCGNEDLPTPVNLDTQKSVESIHVSDEKSS